MGHLGKAYVTGMGSDTKGDYTKTLSTLHFHITRRCSHRCRHCSVDAGPRRESVVLRLHEIQRMADEAAELGTVYFDISGGDPLTLEKKFVLRTVGYSCKKGLSACISTNAQQLSAQYAEELADVGLHKLKFSLYGATPQTHDDFTGVPGSFERVVRGIHFSKRAGIEVWVNSVVTPKNLDEFQDLPSLLGPREVDLVQLSSIVPSGRGGLASDYTFSEDGLERAVEILDDRLSGLNHAFTITLFPDPDKPAFGNRYCDYFYDRLTVDHNGNVIPCCLLPENLKRRLGNVRDGLADVYCADRIRQDPLFYWLGKGHEEMRRKLGYKRTSHNLCSVCIDMLSLLLPLPKQQPSPASYSNMQSRLSNE